MSQFNADHSEFAPISLVIPFNSEYESLYEILSGVNGWIAKPSEINIISSNLLEEFQKNKFRDALNNANIDLNLIEYPDSFPGKSRNLGVDASKYEIIAFLDSKTLPLDNWLAEGYSKIKENTFDIVWGQTYYEAKTFFEKILRSATYGEIPLTTIPGSIIYKRTFSKVGFFIERVRAGEDGEWISRSQLLELRSVKSFAVIKYIGLEGMRFLELVRKWFRNHLLSYSLPHLKIQRDIYFYFLAIVLLLVAYNWNNISYDELLKGWDTSSWLYIPNVTKISFALIAIPYFILRALYIPIKKGVRVSYLLKGNFLPIFIISALLDVVKVMAFTISKFIRARK